MSVTLKLKEASKFESIAEWLSKCVQLVVFARPMSRRTSLEKFSPIAVSDLMADSEPIVKDSLWPR